MRLAGRVARTRRAPSAPARGLGGRARDARARHEGAAHRRRRAASAPTSSRAAQPVASTGRTISPSRTRATRWPAPTASSTATPIGMAKLPGLPLDPSLPRAPRSGSRICVYRPDRHGAAQERAAWLPYAGRRRHGRRPGGRRVPVVHRSRARRRAYDAHVRRGDRGGARGGLTAMRRALPVPAGRRHAPRALRRRGPAGARRRRARLVRRAPAARRGNLPRRDVRLGPAAGSAGAARHRDAGRRRVGCGACALRRGLASAGHRAALPAGASSLNLPTRYAAAILDGRRSSASPIRSPPASRSSGCARISSSRDC